MKKTLAIIVSSLIVLGSLYVYWLRLGVTSTEWAIELIGGDKNLKESFAVAPEDVLFFKSLNHNPSGAESIAILSNTSCHTPDKACADINLSIANVLAITGKNPSTAKDLIEIYSNTLSDPCPLKVEISQLIYETSKLAEKPNKDLAGALVKTIQKKGGLIHSINNIQCNQYISTRPYLAKAYLFYLSTLISMSDYSPGSAWLYLLFKSGHKI